MKTLDLNKKPWSDMVFEDHSTFSKPQKQTGFNSFLSPLTIKRTVTINICFKTASKIKCYERIEQLSKKLDSVETIIHPYVLSEKISLFGVSFRRIKPKKIISLGNKKRYAVIAEMIFVQTSFSSDGELTTERIFDSPPPTRKANRAARKIRPR